LFPILRGCRPRVSNADESKHNLFVQGGAVLRSATEGAPFAAHMLQRERVKPLTDEEKAAGAKLIAAWVMSAPRAAARAYCKAVDAIMGGHNLYTPAELLFSVANINILAHIDLSTASFSISQLRIPKVVEVISIRQASGGKPLSPVDNKGTKVNVNDALELRGTACALAQICFAKQNGQVYLANPKLAKEELIPKIRAAKAALLAAAEDLQRRLARRARPLIEARRLARAASKIQAIFRAKVFRQVMATSMKLRRRKLLVARLNTRKQIARMLKSALEKPILLAGSVVFAADQAITLTKDARPMTNGDVLRLFMFANDRVRARAYTSTVNKMISAAPEGHAPDVKRFGGPPVFPRPKSPLALLFHEQVELTASIDERCNNMQLAEFETPEDVAVTRICQHGVESKVYKKTTAKLGTGDAMTLKGHLHTLAALVVVKDGVLTLLPAKARNQSAHAKLLKDQRGSINSAERLAVWLQRLVRFRIAERKRQREHHAILVIQAAWLMHRVAREGTDSTWSVSFLEQSKLRERGTPTSVLEEAAGASRSSANMPVNRTASGWSVLRTEVKVGAVMKNKLNGVRQKKKPTKAKKAKEASFKEAKAAVPLPSTHTGRTNRFRSGT
jgi:hypothetical protein